MSYLAGTDNVFFTGVDNYVVDLVAMGEHFNNSDRHCVAWTAHVVMWSMYIVESSHWL